MKFEGRTYEKACNHPVAGFFIGQSNIRRRAMKELTEVCPVRYNLINVKSS